VQRLNPVIEDNDPVVVMSDFPYRSRHVTSLRKTWVGLNWSERAA
jgi:NADH:ubiquinone oxidoreductase subunit C